MSEIAIRVEGLGKQYRIGVRRERYKALRDTIADAARWPVRAVRSLFSRNGRGAAAEDTFWALQNVSFEIKRGDVVGVIGRNGAGKSTLLKILSRITEPTRGRADIHGRVGSLLEVGTGFHPELTGRENIYLNGAILGMRKTEIERKFDEIVAFAEVERFIDTMVKHYSSGMYLRLAFAVAAHLEQEILLVDEVLAVGDAEFQKKCFNKVREIGHADRTVLFVSHNLSAIRHICSQAVILENGGLSRFGPVDSTVDKYLSCVLSEERNTKTTETLHFTVHEAIIESETSPVIRTFDRVKISVTYTPKVDIPDPGVYVAILSPDYQRLAGLDFKDFATAPPSQCGVRGVLGFEIPDFPFLPGRYLLEVYLKDMANHLIDRVPIVYPFEVIPSAVYGGRAIDSWYGFVGVRCHVFHGQGV